MKMNNYPRIIEQQIIRKVHWFMRALSNSINLNINLDRVKVKPMGNDILQS